MDLLEVVRFAVQGGVSLGVFPSQMRYVSRAFREMFGTKMCIRDFVYNPHMVQWAVANELPWNAKLCAYAARYGQYDTLTWLCDQGCPINSWACNYAMKAKDWDMYLLARKRGARHTKTTFLRAVATGDTDLTLRLVWVGCPFDYGATYIAACHNHNEMLKWLVDLGLSLDQSVITALIKHRNLPMIDWALDLRMREENNVVGNRYNMLSDWDILAIVRCGWLELARLIPPLTIQNRCLCLEAAKRGHTEMLEWLRANGAPWTPYTYPRFEKCACYHAAHNGHLEAFVYAYEHGCPANELQLYAMIAKRKHMHIAEWFIAQGGRCAFLMRKALGLPNV